MLRKLIDHSPDLRRLRDEGFEIKIRSSHILISGIPYFNTNREVDFGTLVSVLTVAGDKAGTPNNHVAHFIGEQPCNKDGSVITSLLHSQNTATLADGVVVDRSFSNKPPGGYSDFYHKMTTYINIISGPVQSMDSSITPRTFKLVNSDEWSSEFNYPDTNSSRAGISTISDKLKEQKVGIIGVGGTGSYLLDFLAKCPVKEIRIFDNDEFILHNAFRSPGAPGKAVLKQTPKKIHYFHDIYSRMHPNIVVREKFIVKSNLNELQDLDFVFICVDQGDIKEYIFDFLHKNEIGFIDVGMGIEVSDDNSLFGLLRVTTSFDGEVDHIISKGRVSLHDNDNEDEYTQNIQIAELNALNASLAIIKWKKLLGFYYMAENEKHSLYSIDDNSIINEDFAT